MSISMMHADTKVLTEDGTWKSLRDVSHLTQSVPDVHELRIASANKYINSDTHTIRCTRPFKWNISGVAGLPQDTWDIRTYDKLKHVTVDSGYHDVSWLAGFLRGLRWSGGEIVLPSHLRHYANKIAEIRQIHPEGDFTQRPLVGKEQIGSYIAGLVAARPQPRGRLTIGDRELMEWIGLNSPMAGFIQSTPITTKRRVIRSRIMDVNEANFAHGRHYDGWRVYSVTKLDGEHPCCPVNREYVTPGGIIVGTNS